MKDQVISFETAVLAKDKGFDIPCFYHYVSDSYMEEYFKPYIKFQYDLGSHINHLGPVTNTDFKLFLEHGMSGEMYIWSKAITAPTQSLLQKWVREKYNIDIVIKRHFEVYNVIEVTKYDADNDLNESILDIGWQDHTSYEDALEEALQEILKII